MSNTIAYVDNQTLTNIADAIRSKTGTNEKMLLSDIPDTIRNLDTSDITALDTRVTAVENAITGKADSAEIGDLSQLETTAKNDLVSAINEENEAVAGLNERFTQQVTKKVVFESGTFADADGATKLQNVARLRNCQLISITDIYSITIPYGYSAWIFRLNSDTTLISALSGWKSGTLAISDIVTGDTAYLNIAIKKTDTPQDNISEYAADVSNQFLLVTRTQRNGEILEWQSTLMYGNLTISHSETTTVAKGYYYALDNPIPKGATIIFTNTSDVQYTLALVDTDGNMMSSTVLPSGKTTQIYVERDAYQLYSYCPANATWSFSVEVMGISDNAVAFYTQSKTDEEKQTARTNIGAASAKTVADYIGYKEFVPKTNNYIIGTTLGGSVSLSATTANWVYSVTPIYVRKGETIHCKTRANAMCTIATASTNDFSTAVCRAVANDDTSIKEYQYIAENNCYAWVSGRVNETSAYVDYESLYDIGTKATGKQTYTVKKDGSGDFATFTGALNALKNNAGEKTIYVYSGTYDIFEEMGGAEYIQSITSPTSLNWKDVNALVSDNTEIIGIGNVILSYEPEDSEIASNDHAFLFAALNIPAVSCKVENITVKAKNCRHAIHIENGTAENKIDLLFENVRVYMGRGGVRNAQALGTGIGNNATWKFKNCLFHNETSGGCFTSHTNVPVAGDSASIVFEGCVFTITGQTETGAINIVQLISAYNTTPENITNYARFVSCYATGKLALVNGYDSRPVTKKQLFDFTAINCVCGGIFTSSSFEDSESVNRY